MHNAQAEIKGKKENRAGKKAIYVWILTG